MTRLQDLPETAARPGPAGGASLFRNRSDLLGHGDAELRGDLLSILEAGIRAVDPGTGTRRLVSRSGRTLRVADRTFELKRGARVFVAGAGKGSFPIAESLEEILGDLIEDGLVIVKRGETRRLSRIRVMEAGHPLPDEDSIRGAREILDLLARAEEDDIVFLAVTGGASSLMTLPPDGITLDHLRRTGDLLLKSGAAIPKINTVRRHLCRMKGGRLAAAVHPATAITLTLDTAPEGLPWPDPCLPDPSTFRDALEVLREFDLTGEVPAEVLRYFEESGAFPDRETVKRFCGMKTFLWSVGDPASACEGAAARARELGYLAEVVSTRMEGEAKDLGIFFAGMAREIVQKDRPFPVPCALISGGETTVTVGRECGRGGPNQETVLGFAAAFGVDGARAAFAAIDTDGTDGPTDLAGGIVDGRTRGRAEALGLNIAVALKSHSGADALEALGDALVTGHTGTNVMNLRVLLVK